MKIIKRLNRIFFKCLRPAEGKETLDVPKVDIVKRTFTPLELEIFKAVNLHRQKIGKRELISNMKLSNIAYHHSVHMAHKKTITHSGFPIRVAQAKHLVDSDWVGEVLAKGYTTANGILKGWLKSKTHKKVIESDKAIFFGVSVVWKKRRSYVTLLLID